MDQPEHIDQKTTRPTTAPDDALFERLVQQHNAALFHFVYRFLGDYDTASDICQQVFVQLYTFLPTLHTDRPLAPWLFHVARNRCLDELRRKRALSFTELEHEGGHAREEEDLSLLHLVPDPHPLPDEVLEQHDVQRLLWEAIRSLPPKLRRVVALRYGNELSYAEIGAILHIPPATAKTYFQRAKPLLRAFLTRRGLLTLTA
ncbi:MAG TPA: sigma-70 family RNA polymerase sigma factor [Ktedonobacterales bacterium]|nr:sigma-70 family RNA polymerase sigma factor [Ktedonobacterales bacterium]